MYDPLIVDKIINRGDAIIVALQRAGFTFKIPMIRCQVAAVGFLFVWNGMSREDLTKEIMRIGFSNLDTLEIINVLVILKQGFQRFQEKKEQGLIKTGLNTEAKRLAFEERMRAKVKKGIF